MAIMRRLRSCQLISHGQLVNFQIGTDNFCPIIKICFFTNSLLLKASQKSKYFSFHLDFDLFNQELQYLFYLNF